MALAAEIGIPDTGSVGTTLTRIDPGDGVDYVWVRPDADAYLVYSDTLAEGDALPADRWPIPADEAWPAKVFGRAMFVASASGTISVTVLGDE